MSQQCQCIAPSTGQQCRNNVKKGSSLPFCHLHQQCANRIGAAAAAPAPAPVPKKASPVKPVAAKPAPVAVKPAPAPVKPVAAKKVLPAKPKQVKPPSPKKDNIHATGIISKSQYENTIEMYGENLGNFTLGRMADETGDDFFPLVWGHFMQSLSGSEHKNPRDIKIYELTEGIGTEGSYPSVAALKKLLAGDFNISLMNDIDWQNFLNFQNAFASTEETHEETSPEKSPVKPSPKKSPAKANPAYEKAYNELIKDLKKEKAARYTKVPTLEKYIQASEAVQQTNPDYKIGELDEDGEDKVAIYLIDNGELVSWEPEVADKATSYVVNNNLVGRPPLLAVYEWREKMFNVLDKQPNIGLEELLTAIGAKSPVKPKGPASKSGKSTQGTVVPTSTYEKVLKKYPQSDLTIGELAAEYGKDAFPVSWGQLIISSGEDRESNDPNEVVLYEIEAILGDLYEELPEQTPQGLKEEIISRGNYGNAELLSDTDFQNLFNLTKTYAKISEERIREALARQAAKK